VSGAKPRGLPVEVSVIVPTFNEADNLPVLLDRLHAALAGHAYELIVVDDDSPDGTWRIAQTRAVRDPTLRVIRRIGRRGLSSAVLEGMDAAAGSIMAVLDADLQHDETILPDLIAEVRGGRADVAIGSREAPGGSYGDFGRVRRALSFVGAQVASAALGVDVRDPMSGYFAVSAERYAAVRTSVNPRGFKILLDILATGTRPEVVEIGYGFRSRRAGETKLSSRVMVSFGLSVAELSLRRARSRFADRRPSGGGQAPAAWPPAFGSYVGVVVMATSVRVAGTSLLPIVGYSGLLSLAVVELAILAEYAGHQRFTFPVVNGERRSGSSRRRLAAFHLVAANSLLAQAGLGSVVTSMLARPTTGVRLVPVLGLVTAGVMVTIVAAYHLNRVVTWPAQTEAGGGATELPSPNSSRRTVDQQSRPMTPSTSEAISSTARR